MAKQQRSKHKMPSPENKRPNAPKAIGKRNKLKLTSIEPENPRKDLEQDIDNLVNNNLWDDILLTLWERFEQSISEYKLEEQTAVNEIDRERARGFRDKYETFFNATHHLVLDFCYK